MASTPQHPPFIPPLSERSLVTLTVCISIVTLLTIFVVALGALPFGSPSVWTWQYKPLGVPTRILWGVVPFAAVVVVLLGPGHTLLQSEAPTRKQEWGALATLCIAAFVSANAVMLMNPIGWAYPASLVVNPAANSYFSTAMHQPDLIEMLHDYPGKMSGFVSHAQTQSAGPVVFSRLTAQSIKALPFTSSIADTLFALSPGISSDVIVQFCKKWEPNISASDISAAFWVGLLMIAIGSLSVIPLYFLGKWLFNTGTGLFAAVSFVLLPAFALFSVSVDQMYPLVTAVGLCGIWAGMRSIETKFSRALLWLGLTGIWLGAWLFFNMGLIVAVALCGLFALFAAYVLHVSLKRLCPGAILFIAGVFIAPLLLWIFFGYNLWAVFLASNHLRDSLYYGARSYPVSLWSNLWDFFAFCGLPVVLLWAWQMRLLSRSTFRTAAPALLAAFVIALLLLDATGRVRGEAARMWMFLTPPVLIGAGAVWFSVWCKSRPAAAWLLALQLAQLIAFQYFVRVWGY